MVLKLRITDKPEQVSLEEQRLLDTGSLSIGRADQVAGGGDQHWVLPDPGAVPRLSRLHCTIEYRDGAYWLTDLSSNGVYFANAPERLPPQTPTQLPKSAVLELCHNPALYSIAVEQAERPPAAVDLPPDTTLELVLSPLPMGETETRTITASGISIGRGEDNDWVLADRDHSRVSRLHCRIDVIEGHYWIVDLSRNGVFGPEGRLERGTQMPLRDGMVLEFCHPAEYRLQVHFRSAPVAAKPAANPAEPWWERDDSAIDDDRTPPPTPPEPGSDAPPWANGAPPPPPPPPPADDALPWASAAAPPPSPPPTDDALPWANGAPPPPPPTVDDALPWASSSPSTAGEPASGVVDTAPPTPPPGAATRQTTPEQAIAAYLTGAGLSPVEVPVDDPLAFLHTQGICFRETVAGLLALLAARDQARFAFRLADHTEFGARLNNPLKKLTPTSDRDAQCREALTRMLATPGDAFKPSPAAVREVLADIGMHEQALLAGLRSALSQVLEALGPATIDGAERASSTHDKARCWERFCERHRSLGEEGAERFHRLFADAFQKAYDEQIRQYHR